MGKQRREDGCLELEKKYPPKVKAMYEAVLSLFSSGRELSTLTVSEITAKAGIGKGTAYEYFSTKEEMIVGAIQYEAERHISIIFEFIQNGQSFQEIIFQGLDMLEENHERYGGFVMLEKIIRDSTMTGSGLLDELERRKEDCGSAKRLTEKLFRLAADKGLIKEGDAFQVWSAILSQFAVYAFYLTHQELTAGIGRGEVRQLVYKNIIKLLN